jgi:type IV pilus assembly protein PilB
LSEEVIKHLGISNDQAENSVFYHGRGCPACGETGYLGRLPIFEFLDVDNEVSEKIIANAPESQIREVARKKGYGGLLDSGVKKVLQGLTTAEEVIRIAFTDKG